MATRKKSKTEPLTESAHRIWLAGLGALATVEEEGGKLFKELVARGEEYGGPVREPVKTARGRVRDTVDSVRSRAGKTVERLEGAFDDRVQAVLNRIGVPSRDEIADLAARVERLTRSVVPGTSSATKKRRTGASKATSKKKAAAKKRPAAKKKASPKRKTRAKA